MTDKLASGTRRRVLEAVAGSPVAVDARSVAEALGLHVTTARFHLDNLERAHLVRRQPDPVGHRGRPRLLFTIAASERIEDSRGQLIDILSGTIATGSDGEARSIEAGRQWANDLSATHRGVSGETGLLAVLEELGFDPKSDSDESIGLYACPFRDAARRHPEIVCSVHRGLIDRVLELGDAGGRRSARLLPFVQPDFCSIALAHAG